MAKYTRQIGSVVASITVAPTDRGIDWMTIRERVPSLHGSTSVAHRTTYNIGAGKQRCVPVELNDTSSAHPGAWAGRYARQRDAQNADGDARHRQCKETVLLPDPTNELVVPSQQLTVT
jgi:hypothetical protein